MKYDAILMVVPEKIELLKTTYAYLLKNLGAERIILVANKECKQQIDEVFGNVSQISFMDEDEVLDGLTFNSIREHLERICGDGHRTGWYFQQFLKMAYAYKCKNEYYLLFDSDTVALNEIPYFGDDGKPQFITKREYYQFYFDTMDKLFGGKVGRVDPNVSYIAENMMINKKVMIEIMESIEANSLIPGDVFYKKILNAINPDIVKNTGFSEFETYGNYVKTLYPDMYNNIKLRTQRLGTFLFGKQPSTAQLEWAAKDYDIMSFESHGKTWLAKKTSSERTREKYSAKDLFKKYKRISDLVDILMRRPVSRID